MTPADGNTVGGRQELIPMETEGARDINSGGGRVRSREYYLNPGSEFGSGLVQLQSDEPVAGAVAHLHQNRFLAVL